VGRFWIWTGIGRAGFGHRAGGRRLCLQGSVDVVWRRGAASVCGWAAVQMRVAFRECEDRQLLMLRQQQSVCFC
jgi:hypothetical protein